MFLMSTFMRRVLMAVIFGAFAVGQTSSFAPDYAQAKISAARMLKLLDRVPFIDSYSTKGDSPVRDIYDAFYFALLMKYLKFYCAVE